MSLHVYYQIGDQKHVMQIPFDDYFDILTRKYQNDCESLWGMDCCSKIHAEPIPTEIPKEELLGAVRSLLAAMTSDPEFKQINYFFLFEQFGPHSLGQHCSGITIKGKEGSYSLKSGIGFCTMTRLVLSPDQKNILFIDPEDIREVPFLETVHSGIIRIKKVKKPIAIKSKLKKLLDFLENCVDTLVIKSLS